MKKVISALTVAAMCASMSASVMPAFAINAADAEFYLKAAKADKGTISADGATITFASAADAKGAKITIQEFIKADTAEPYVEQILSGFRVKDGVKSIKLGESGVDYLGTVGDSKSYKIGETEIDTDMFVSCFSTVDEFDEFDPNVKQFMWGHSDNWSWKDTYDGADTLNLIWAQPNGAKFNSDKTDTYPFTEFYATIGDDIKDGTYTIEILDTWDNLANKSEKNPTGTADGSTINAGKKVTKVTKTKNLTIVVGDAAAPTEKPTEATEKPTDPTNLLYGDANLDGKVDIMDAILVNKTLVGVGKMEDAGFKVSGADEAKSYMDSQTDLDNPAVSANIRRLARNEQEDANSLLRGTLSVTSVKSVNGFYQATVHASFELIGFATSEVNTFDDYYTAVDADRELAIRKAQDLATRHAVDSLGQKALLTAQDMTRGGTQHFKTVIMVSGITAIMAIRIFFIVLLFYFYFRAKLRNNS